MLKNKNKTKLEINSNFKVLIERIIKLFKQKDSNKMKLALENPDLVKGDDGADEESDHI
jgi:hypothetical protein